MRLTIVILLIVTCAILVSVVFRSCVPVEGGPVMRNEIFGRYVANHKEGEDWIEINPSGTYDYSYRGTDGTTVINSGKWQYNSAKGQTAILFEDFVFGYSLMRGDRGYWPVSFERTRGEGIIFYLEYDLGYYYMKQRAEVDTLETKE